MPRSQRSNKSVVDELFELLSAAPLWLGPIVAMIAFVACRWGIPLALSATSVNETGRTLTQVWSDLAVKFSPLVGGGLLLIWGAAEVRKWINRRRLDQQTGFESIDHLSWQEFESLLCEAFRRQGFAVEHCGGPLPDGGIDIRLSKADAATLVQCKHWKQRQVGVTTIRELLGVVSSERAQSGIVVTSGAFTDDAIEFAARNPIRLIDGRELVSLIENVRYGGIPGKEPDSGRPTAPFRTAADDLGCPLCGAEMRLRTAKTGRHAGGQFYGCSRFPNCRGVRNPTFKSVP